VSVWLGVPRISQEFAQIGGVWFPSYTRAVTTGFLLGTTELEIRYTDYRLGEADSPARN